MIIEGIDFQVGDLWREVDPRTVAHPRVVRVCGWNAKSKRIQICCNNRRTWARANRFNGKNRGYARVTTTASLVPLFMKMAGFRKKV